MFEQSFNIMLKTLQDFKSMLYTNGLLNLYYISTLPSVFYINIDVF